MPSTESKSHALIEALDTVLDASRVIPVLTIEAGDDVVALGRALVAGGVPVAEITLRTPVALQAVRTLAESGLPLHVGVGTALGPEDLDAAKEAGAAFAVSPGTTERLVERAMRLELPLLPGVSTASEVMNARDLGLRRLKFFPAESVGGAAMLRRLGAVFPDVRFVPTGGLTPANAPAYLALSNVAAVGGSWLAPREALEAGDYAAIERLAAAAAALG